MEALRDNNGTLAIITNSLSGGGAENAMRLLHISLPTKLNSHLIALNGKTRIDQEVSRSTVLKREWGTGIFRTISTFFSFQKLIWDLNPNTLIVNCELPELFVAFTPFRKKRIICVEHTSKPWLKRRILGYIVRNILKLRKTDWVTVSKNDLNVWCAKNRALHIPNPVLAPILGNPVRDLSALLIGRLTDGKRPDWAIAATGKSGISLNVFGDGHLLNSLKQLAVAKACEVKFHGYVDNCWSLVSNRDILLMPSAFEGDGIVVVEAILAGLPILAADNSDLRRFGLPEDCYCSNEEEMTEKLIRFKSESLASFSPAPNLISAYRQERGLDSVVSTWVNLINAKS